MSSILLLAFAGCEPGRIDAVLESDGSEARLVVSEGEAVLFDGEVKAASAAPGSLRLSLPADRLDLVAPFLAGPAPLQVDPPAPYAGLDYSLQLVFPRADHVTVRGTGAGCGELAALTVQGGRLWWHGRAGAGGDCVVEAKASVGKDVVLLTTSFRVAAAVGQPADRDGGFGQGVYRAAGVATYPDRAVDADGLAKAAVDLPIRGARVEVRRAADDFLLAEGLTDQGGVFDLSFQSVAAPHYYVAVVAERHAEGLEQEVVDGDGSPWAFASARTFDASQVPARADIHLAVEGPAASAFNIFDAGVSAAVALGDLVPAAPLTWIWSPGIDVCGTGQSCYREGRARIGVFDSPHASDAWDDSVLLHQVGHFVLDDLGATDAPGGIHGAGTRIDPRLAWAEGAATFLGAFSQGTPRVLDAHDGDLRVAYEIEALVGIPPGATRTGLLSEAVVAGTLWDLADGADEVGDTVHDPGRVFETLLEMAHRTDVGARGADLEDFLVTFDTLHPAAGS